MEEFENNVLYNNTLRNLRAEIRRISLKLPENKDIRTKENPKVELPAFKLLSYTGELYNWTSFWSRFEHSVDLNPNIQPSIKFDYLLSCLDGNALNLVSGLPIDNTSYSIATKLLHNRFGRQSIILKTLYKELNELPYTENSFDSISNFLEKLEKI